MTAISYIRDPLETLEAIVDVAQPGWRDEVIVHRHLPGMVPSSAMTMAVSAGLEK